jgi:hypothetical protein
MSEIRDALIAIANRYPVPSTEPDEIMGAENTPPSWARRPRHVLIAILLCLGLFAMGFGVGNAAGGGRAGPQLNVPLRVSEQCDSAAADVSVSPSIGPPGSLVDISGPIYYTHADGSVWVPAQEQIQVWWDIDPSSWTQVSGAAIAASEGQPITDDRLLASVDTRGACSFSVSFSVPEAPPGSYSVSVLRAAGTDGAALYGAFAFEVS